MKLKLFFLIIAIVIGYDSYCQNKIITTIAGNGGYGYNGDSIPAVNAKLYHPADIAIDKNGNVYVSDHFNDRIRKISTDGIITTIAGNGSQGYSGDGALATAATMREPDGIAIDKSGNLYFCDWGNQVIRKIDTFGIITTFAGNGIGAGGPNGTFSGDGGPAILAGLNNPQGITIDTLGNFYIADEFNQRIRKIDTSGIIHTIAGIGTAGYNGDGGLADTTMLSYPMSVAFDGYGNIYIADNSNSRVRKINTSGIISTIAGNGNFNSSGDGGLAILAEISPMGIAIDAVGRIYVSENLKHRVRMIDTNGIITTIVGTGVPGYNGDNIRADSAKVYSPLGIEVDKYGNLFIADEDNYRIRKVTDTSNHNTYVKDIKPQNSIDIYPNPARDRLFVISSNIINEIAIINVMGQTMIKQNNHSSKVIINVSGLNSGVYFIQMSDKDGRVVTRRFVKD